MGKVFSRGTDVKETRFPVKPSGIRGKGAPPETVLDRETSWVSKGRRRDSQGIVTVQSHPRFHTNVPRPLCLSVQEVRPSLDVTHVSAIPWTVKSRPDAPQAHVDLLDR